MKNTITKNEENSTEQLNSRLDTEEKRIKKLKDVQEELLRKQQREPKYRNNLGTGLTEVW